MRPPASGCRSAPARSLPSAAAENCAAVQLCNFAEPSREKSGKTNKSSAKLFCCYYCFCPFNRFIFFFFPVGIWIYFFNFAFFLSFILSLSFSWFLRRPYISFFILIFLFCLSSLSLISLSIPPPTHPPFPLFPPAALRRSHGAPCGTRAAAQPPLPTRVRGSPRALPTVS